MLLVALILGIILVTGCTQTNKNTSENTQTTEKSTGTTLVIPIPAGAKNNFVEITADGFNPKTLTINAGDTVTWVNKDSGGHWPASAMHPTHEVYPDSSITKCGTDEQKNIFDACTALVKSEKWSFTFNNVGTWNYHDHLDPSLWGTIIVK